MMIIIIMTNKKKEKLLYLHKIFAIVNVPFKNDILKFANVENLYYVYFKVYNKPTYLCILL